jgi:hypothetical protein
MVLKIALLVALYFIFKNVFKAMRIVKEYEIEKKKTNSNNKSNDDIVDAEYTVIDD